MQIFTDRKKQEELENKIKDQEQIILNLRSEIRTLAQKNKELDRSNRLLEGLLESKKITKGENDKLVKYIKDLEEKLENYNPNLKPRKQEIKQQEIDLIKKMHSEKYTYREIKSKTGWSLNTISKVINKFYD